MSHKYYVFTDPSTALCQLFHDSGWNGVAYAQNHPSGRSGQVFDIPDSVQPNQGARLRISEDGFQSLEVRGILTFADETYAYMQCDDFTLFMNSIVPPPTPPTDIPTGAKEIIDWVYKQADYNLATHEGCGLFTEDCATALHQYNSELWGHIRKNPGQNQYNGHAVDAIQCLGGPEYGIWDIIHDSVSPNATPSYNNKGQAEPTLYCYPAGACVESQRSITVTKKKKK